VLAVLNAGGVLLWAKGSNDSFAMVLGWFGKLISGSDGVIRE
jgi:hypothetical protein